MNACARVWNATATCGFCRIRSSFLHIPTELFTATVPGARSRSAKFVTGVSTTPFAGVTWASATAWSPPRISSTASGHMSTTLLRRGSTPASRQPASISSMPNASIGPSAPGSVEAPGSDAVGAPRENPRRELVTLDSAQVHLGELRAPGVVRDPDDVDAAARPLAGVGPAAWSPSRIGCAAAS